MSVSGNVEQTAEANVVPLFAKIQINTEAVESVHEPMMDWDLEEPLETVQVKVQRTLVTENQFPDQSLFILNDQVSKLKESIERLKFYLNDVDDLLPRKN